MLCHFVGQAEKSLKKKHFFNQRAVSNLGPRIHYGIYHLTRFFHMLRTFRIVSMIASMMVIILFL